MEPGIRNEATKLLGNGIMAENLAADVKTLPTPPPLDNLRYDDRSPEESWRRCVEFGERWKSESADQSPCSKEIRVEMDMFKKRKAIDLVWMSNKLEGTLPKGASEYKTYSLLTELLEVAPDARAKLDLSGSSDDGTGSEDRKSKQQLVQHMQAYCRLCDTAITRGEELSVDLIKETHGLLMDGLKNDGRTVSAGAYREGPASADGHSFPEHKHIPATMDKIVREYSVKCSEADHDPYQLASWLLFEVISLHPFEDGNGRLCRLLWCYSLMECHSLLFSPLDIRRRLTNIIFEPFRRVRDGTCVENQLNSILHSHH